MASELKPVLDTALDAAVVMRLDGVVAGWNRTAESIFGWSAAQAVGRLLADLIIPAEAREAHMNGLRRYAATGQGAILGRRIEVTAQHKDGRLFPVELAITITHDQGDRVYLGFLRDITERKRAEAALRESERRLRATYEHANVSIAETDSAGRFLRMNAQLCKITGYSREELEARTFLDITHPDDVEPDRTLYRRQWRGDREPYTIEKRYVRKDGTVVWIEVLASLVFDDAGTPLYGIRVVRDITERKDAEASQKLLVQEMTHRVTNVIAVAQSIARQTFRDCPPDQIAAYSGRLAALSTAHRVVVDGKWDNVGLQEVVGTVLSPFRGEVGGGIECEGPSITVPQKVGAGLSMALYELATNAAKHGALTRKEGRVTVRWSLETQGTRPCLRMTWQELGGPPVTRPTRTGFGLFLIERGLPADMKGDVELEFRPEGLVCFIEVPLPSE